MAKPTAAETINRAAAELRAASDALRQAHALFAALAAHESGVAIDVIQLSRIGRELTCTYAERVEGEAEWMEDITHA